MSTSVAFISSDSSSNQTFLDIISNKITILVTSPPTSLNMGDYLPPIFTSCYISNPNDLISQFCWDSMLVSLNLALGSEKYVSNLVGYSFVFNPDLILVNNIIIPLLGNSILQIVLLSITVLLMSNVSTVLCNGSINSLFTSLFNLVYNSKDHSVCNQKNFVFHNFSFLGLYNSILNMTYWIINFMYNLSYNNLYYDILYILYNNIKHLIPNLQINYTLHINSLVNLTFNTYFSFNSVISFSYNGINIIYASLTIVYIILGWLSDYLSFTWLSLSNSTEFNYVMNLVFWIKRLLYAILYIIWLFVGVISTNGLYFLILSSIDTIKNVNIIMTIVGSFITYVGSGLWYFYGQATLPGSLSINDSIIFPLLLNPVHHGSSSALYSHVINTLLYYVLLPVSFNAYSTLRRSCLEWVSFFGMVITTYGTWNLYTIYVFDSLWVVYHLLIWAVPSFLGALGLIYLEEVSPSYGYLLYGFCYLLLWQSVCFFTNTIVVAFFSITNAIKGLSYLLPLNLFLAFIYSVPLYRGTLSLTVFSRFIHVLFFTLLICVTLICAGLIWYLIGTV